tara:strand:+ start:1380 stop:1646 length:267 start_codon:yes stop_codon:yes gene_type:complete
MNGLIWAFLAFIVVAITKYLTALRLRKLRERREKDYQSASDLRRVLDQVSEKEDNLKTETEMLRTKLTAMRNVVVNLERMLQKQTESR